MGPRAESAIGQSVERADGGVELAGQAEFTGDIRLPGMLYGAVLHSPAAHARRHNMSCRMRTAAAADGTVLGRTAEAWLDTGAYADNGPRVTATAGDAAPGPYRWQAVQVQAYCVYTNTGAGCPTARFGATHLQWIGGRSWTRWPAQLDMDRLEIRRRNLLRPGEQAARRHALRPRPDRRGHERQPAAHRPPADPTRPPRPWG